MIYKFKEHENTPLLTNHLNMGGKNPDGVEINVTSKYFTKGKMIIVDGSLQNNNYTDKNGVKHYTFVVKADNVSFGESKSAEGQASVTATAPPPASNTDVADIGGLDEFEEIIGDGDVPF